MKVSATQVKPDKLDTDVVAVGLFEGEKLDEGLRERVRTVADEGLLTGKEGLLLLHMEGPDLLVAGLGEREKFDAEKARSTAAKALERAKECKPKSVAWAVPEGFDDAQIAAAITEGTLLASYKFDRYLSGDGEKDEAEAEVEELKVAAATDVSAAVEEAELVTQAQNAARELQNLPANEVTPTYLAEYALMFAADVPGLSTEALGRKEIEAKKMGGMVAVSQGSDQEPRMIVMRYKPKDAKGKVLGLVGKAVTFDSGGISIKPSAKMDEMKMDMSGGAAVIEATAAIARLRLPVEVVAVVPSTENMLSGGATRPGDIITTYAGKTVEIINTDAEGRVILADGLTYCCELGAERIVDLATLTGAIIVSLGSTYAGLMSNDDGLAKAVSRAGESAGEPVWRLPLHQEYFELTKGKITDLVNSSGERKASSIYAAEFLKQFVGERPWAHLDIAGTAWGTGRPYFGKGPTGFGVRLLVELAKSLSQ